MAPWPQHHGSKPSMDTVSRLSRLDDLNVLDTSLVRADSSSSDSDIHPRPSVSISTSTSHGAAARPSRPRHSRSMSHPFPSLFSSGKKKRDIVGGGEQDDSDSTDDGGPMTRIQSRSHQRSDRTGSGGQSRDFATGNCMTCGSLVRWPRNLRVFKCTICLTINDLEPVLRPSGSEARGDGGPMPRRGSIQSPNSPPKHPPQVKPLSVEHAKRLVRQCLRSFLVTSLQIHRYSTEDELRSPLGDVLLATSDREVADGFPMRSSSRRGVGQKSSEYVARYVFPEQPTLHPNPLRGSQVSRSYSSSYPERPSIHKVISAQDMRQSTAKNVAQAGDPKRVFKPLEDYIIACFSSFQCINSSFSTRHPAVTTRSGKESIRRKPVPPKREPTQFDSSICNVDPKLLLLGNFAENGSWWTGQEDTRPTKPGSCRSSLDSPPSTGSRSPQLDWAELQEWYSTVINAAEQWTNVYSEILEEETPDTAPDINFPELEGRILKAQDHVQRVLLKATEMLLKRPGRLMKDPEDIRFLLIIFENPLLHASPSFFEGRLQAEGFSPKGKSTLNTENSRSTSGPISGQHSGIIKRILGLLSNSTNECQNQLVAWFAGYPVDRFVRTKELTGSFLTYRLLRQTEKKQDVKVDITDGLIPVAAAGRSVAALHAVVGTSPTGKKPKEPPEKVIYNDDWQIRAAARVMALLFAANNTRTIHQDLTRCESFSAEEHDGSCRHGHALPTSDFYNTLLDYSNLVADFETWEARRGKFAFCQYPFLLSIWAKIQILEYDARRQMQSKARDAFFDSIMSRKNVNQFLVLDVRRDCLVEDSLQAVSEVIGSGGEDIKKRLRISFRGEEGVDAGGLRKEWFLLLVREVFNPDHGMFAYDEDSRYCYFNPNSFETSDQFFLVGVVMGLAIYNSTILDVPLPAFAFRKLLAAAPPPAAGAPGHPRLTMHYTLADLAEYRPRLAKGLRQLLEYDGDVETTFCLDFVVDVEKYGSFVRIPLCFGGEHKAVSNANRREYVDLYVRYLLETEVTRQFEPFKRGFYTVCGGNALSLFRPDEIERLVRGSDETLDVSSLRGVAEYESWGNPQPDGSEPTIEWFWQTFLEAPPENQRKLLLFITGSDRIPAMGPAMLPIKIICLGDDGGRYPTARTCFNVLALWRYTSRKRLEDMLWRAVHESEGFGLK